MEMLCLVGNVGIFGTLFSITGALIYGILKVGGKNRRWCEDVAKKTGDTPGHVAKHQREMSILKRYMKHEATGGIDLEWEIKGMILGPMIVVALLLGLGYFYSVCPCLLAV